MDQNKAKKENNNNSTTSEFFAKMREFGSLG